MDENLESEGEIHRDGPLLPDESYGDQEVLQSAKKGRKAMTSIKPNSAAKRRPRTLLLGVETIACCDLTPDPVPTDNLAVLKPSRTYQRQRTPRLPPAPAKLQLESYSGDFTLDNSPDHMDNFESDNQDLREQILHRQSGFLTREHTERTGTTGLILRASGPQSWSPDLNCQLAKLEQAAETGNAGALLLLEQIRAYGKPRHHFSKRMLVTCARWRKRYCLAYSHARKTQLFTLPSATTLNKRCLPRPISTMGPDSTANVLFDIRPYRYKSGQRFQTKLSMW